MTTFSHPGYFRAGLETVDPEVHAALTAEQARQNDGIELIASENIVSQATLDALGAAIVLGSGNNAIVDTCVGGLWGRG